MRPVWFRRLVLLLLALIVVLLWREQRRARRERLVVRERGAPGWRVVGWVMLLALAVLVLREWEYLRAFVGNATRFRPGMSTDDAVWVVATVAILGAVVLLALRLIASDRGDETSRRRRGEREGRASEHEHPPSTRNRIVVRPAHTGQRAPLGHERVAEEERGSWHSF